MADVPFHSSLDRYRRLCGLSLADCWEAYFALGGRADPAGLNAYLRHGQALVAEEVDILTAAIGEHGRGDGLPGPPDLGAGPHDLGAVPPDLGAGPHDLGAGPPSPADTAAMDLDGAALLVAGGASPSGVVVRIDDGANSTWEMHPHGDEVLVLLSGAVRLTLGHDASNVALLENPYQAIAVPQSQWHLHEAIRAETRVLYVTPVPPLRLEHD